MMIKRYIKPSQKLGNKVIIIGKKNLKKKKLLKLGKYKVNKTMFYQLNKKKMKHKRHYFMQVRRRFLKGMNIRKIRITLTNRYVKYDKFRGMSKKIKYFIFKKRHKNIIAAKNLQSKLKKNLVINYYKRVMYLFKIIYKLNKRGNNKNYIYKYFKRLHNMGGKNLDQNYIYKYFKNIYRKSIQYIISKYCKNKIISQSGTISISTTLRNLLLLQQEKKNLKASIIQYNLNKLS
jgi:hypothetical protein